MDGQDMIWNFSTDLDIAIKDHIINWDELDFINADFGDWTEQLMKCEDYHRRCEETIQKEMQMNMEDFEKWFTHLAECEEYYRRCEANEKQGKEKPKRIETDPIEVAKQEKNKQFIKQIFLEEPIFIRKECDNNLWTPPPPVAPTTVNDSTCHKKYENLTMKVLKNTLSTLCPSPTKSASPTISTFKPLSWTSDVQQKMSTVGRSLLKPQNLTTKFTTTHSLTNSSMSLPSQSSVIKNLESDGDSGRSDSPQSSRGVSDCDETEDELPMFRHDQINVREKLYEYISDGVAYTSRSEEPEDEVDTRRHCRRKEEENLRQTFTTTYTQSDIKRNAINDHCYHLNEPRNIERTSGEISLSETDEEEIDVVSYEKQTAYVMPVLLKQPVSAKQSSPVKQKRPRGRPPGSTNAQNRKRMAESHIEQPPAKRVPRGQRGDGKKIAKNSRTHYSEEEEDKRNQHNNMERQRRISLMKLFEALKWQVPAISATERVPKVSVLIQSKKYCDNLSSEERTLELEKEKQKKLSQYLSKRIAELTDHNRRKLMRTSALQRGN